MSKEGEFEQKVHDVVGKMINHGFECGEVIANYLKKQHPKAEVYKLYRSAVAIEFEKENGLIHVYACGDPHCMGEELNDGTLKNWVREWIITGDRFGPTMHHLLGGQVSRLPQHSLVL